MDRNDQFESIELVVSECNNGQLLGLAQQLLGENWMSYALEREVLIEKISNIIFDSYYDSGAVEEWGPRKYTDWYVCGTLARESVSV